MYHPGAAVPSTGQFMGARQLPAFQPAPHPHFGQGFPPAQYPYPAQSFQASYEASDAQKHQFAAAATAEEFVDELEAELEEDGLMNKMASVGLLYYLTAIGAFLLCLVALPTVWNASNLVYSSTFVYFMGRVSCFWTICFSCLVIVVFTIAMLLVARFGRKEAKTTQTFMLVFTAAITLMGVGLIMLAIPIRTQTQTAYDTLMSDASLNMEPSTAPLSAYYHVLLEMRLKPDCLKKQSIEQCSGYEERDPFTGFLKHMELHLECSGFGYMGNSSAPSSSTQKPKAKSKPKAKLVQMLSTKDPAKHDYVGLLQASGSSVVQKVPVTKEKENGLIAVLWRRIAKKSRKRFSLRQKPIDDHSLLLEVNHTLSKTVDPPWDTVPEGAGDTANNMAATGWLKDYPPTLFTTANFKTTCEGAAARELRFTAQMVTDLMYHEGLFLLLAVIVIGFARLLSMCRSKQQMADDRAQKRSNGGGQYRSYMK